MQKVQRPGSKATARHPGRGKAVREALEVQGGIRSSSGGGLGGSGAAAEDLDQRRQQLLLQHAIARPTGDARLSHTERLIRRIS